MLGAFALLGGGGPESPKLHVKGGCLRAYNRQRRYKHSQPPIFTALQTSLVKVKKNSDQKDIVIVKYKNIIMFKSIWKYVCMYVCMCVCVYVCMYVCMHVCMYVCINVV